MDCDSTRKKSISRVTDMNESGFVAQNENNTEHVEQTRLDDINMIKNPQLFKKRYTNSQINRTLRFSGIP